MKLKTWLKNQNLFPKPGDTVYLIHRDNSGTSLLERKIRTIGTRYLTVDDGFERKFEVTESGDENHLIESCQMGHKAVLYLQKEKAENHLRKEQLIHEIRYHYATGMFLETTSLLRLEAVAAILSNKATLSQVNTFLSALEIENEDIS